MFTQLHTPTSKIAAKVSAVWRQQAICVGGPLIFLFDFPSHRQVAKDLGSKQDQGHDVSLDLGKKAECPSFRRLLLHGKSENGAPSAPLQRR